MSVARTIRSIWRVGPREWWRQLQYIGDAKSGTYVGMDRYEYPVLVLCCSTAVPDRFGNRYYENLNAKEEVPGEPYTPRMPIVNINVISGRHRWVDLAQHEFNASQVPPEWHSWISHIRKDPPTEDSVMKAMEPRWEAAVSDSFRDN